MKKIILYLSTLLVLSSCLGSTKKSKFYNLIPMVKEESISKNTKRISININSVSIPEYLNTPQIITFNDNEMTLTVSEINRWIEPLDKSIQRVISKNIAFYLKNSNVTQSIYVNKSNYTVSINIDKFYGSFNSNVLLEGFWSVANKNGVILYSKSFNYTIAVSDNYVDLTRAKSELINVLSLEIVEFLSKQ